jgi:ribosome-binding factor A
MSSRKHRQRRRSVSPSFLFDDGVDPRNLPDGDGSGRARHKTLQLCAQVTEALHAALAGECRDAVLQALTVVSVTPAAGGSRLVVTVELPVGEAGITREVALQRLERAAGMLRCAVGSAISRRRVPELAFRVVPPSPAPEGCSAPESPPAPDEELPA